VGARGGRQISGILKDASVYKNFAVLYSLRREVENEKSDKLPDRLPWKREKQRVGRVTSAALAQRCRVAKYHHSHSTYYRVWQCLDSLSFSALINVF
jgi:hypothetical protein